MVIGARSASDGKALGAAAEVDKSASSRKVTSPHTPADCGRTRKPERHARTEGFARRAGRCAPWVYGVWGRRTAAAKMGKGASMGRELFFVNYQIIVSP